MAEENNFNNNSNKIGNKIDNPYFMKFLLYLSLVVIIMGVIVGLIFVYQQKINLQHNQYIIEKVEETLSQINLTKAELHEDQARDNQTQKQNRFETDARANQTRKILSEMHDIILDHHQQLQKFIKDENNDTKLLFKGIADAQKQNDEIIQTQKFVSMANNKLLMALANKTGLNVTDILLKK